MCCGLNHVICVPVLPRTAPIQNWPFLSLTPAARRQTPLSIHPHPRVTPSPLCHYMAKAPPRYRPLLPTPAAVAGDALAANAAYTPV